MAARGRQRMLFSPPTACCPLPTMTRDTKRSGISLLVVGLLGVLFFWATDPLNGIVANRSATPIDAVHDARTGTYVGVIGSGVVLAIGVWLLTKRTA
jgi:hypothetical protein